MAPLPKKTDEDKQKVACPNRKCANNKENKGCPRFHILGKQMEDQHAKVCCLLCDTPYPQQPARLVADWRRRVEAKRAEVAEAVGTGRGNSDASRRLAGQQPQQDQARKRAEKAERETADLRKRLDKLEGEN